MQKQESKKKKQSLHAQQNRFFLKRLYFFVFKVLKKMLRLCLIKLILFLIFS